MKRKLRDILSVIIVALLLAGCINSSISKENTETAEESSFYEESGWEVAKETEQANVEKEDEEEKYNASEQTNDEAVENGEFTAAVLSEAEMFNVEKAIEDYYDSINRKVISFEQVTSISSFFREYEGYESNEVVLFEVIVDNSENKRYITIGSKNRWEDCSVLNEGY